MGRISGFFCFVQKVTIVTLFVKLKFQEFFVPLQRD